jgi:hypothetical protein
MIFVTANLSLAAGLILWTFVRPTLAAPHVWIDGVCGLLLGFSVAANLGVLIRTRRCGEIHS